MVHAMDISDKNSVLEDSKMESTENSDVDIKLKENDEKTSILNGQIESAKNGQVDLGDNGHFVKGENQEDENTNIAVLKLAENVAEVMKINNIELAKYQKFGLLDRHCWLENVRNYKKMITLGNRSFDTFGHPLMWNRVNEYESRIPKIFNMKY